MPELEVFINISAKDFLQYYQGLKKNIIAKCDNGKTIQLPANIFRQFVLPNKGVQGKFIITYNHDGSLVNIKHSNHI